MKDLFEAASPSPVGHGECRLASSRPESGDKIAWREPVFDPKLWQYCVGVRSNTGLVMAVRGKETLVIEILTSEGAEPLEPGQITRRRGLWEKHMVWVENRENQQ